MLVRLSRTPRAPKIIHLCFYNAFGITSDRKPKFDAKSCVKFYAAPGEVQLRFLEVHGKLCDRISPRIGQVMPENDEAGVRQTFTQWSRMAVSDDNPTLDRDVSKQEAYWRTICMDTEHVGKAGDDDNLPLNKREYARASSTYAKDFAARIERTREAADDAQTLDDSDPMVQQRLFKKVTWRPDPPSPTQGPNAFHGRRIDGSIRRSATIRSEDEDDEISKINESITSATTSRRFFLTEQGLMGLGPEEMEPNDKIAVLIGGHTPFIIRPNGERQIDSEIGVKPCYKLIGRLLRSRDHGWRSNGGY